MRYRELAGVVTLAAFVAGCEAIAPLHGPDTLRGAIYTDLQGGMPCDGSSAPRELAGIGLRFSDASETVLATTVTTTIATEVVPPRAGDAANQAACRHAGVYEVVLPDRPSYTVEFDVPDPPQRGGYFSGTDELTTQTISRDELERQDFTWSFEVPASYVAP